MNTEQFIEESLKEDIGEGDFTSLSCIPPGKTDTAKLLVKESGIIAGIQIAKMVFGKVDSGLIVEEFKKDGDEVSAGEIVFTVNGKTTSILSAERLVLNFMQRMSGIATVTRKYVDAVKGCRAVILDTRKTTPNMRFFEKMAVKTGGGQNHRFGLYDMIMIKDNHVDASGGIGKAIRSTKEFLRSTNKDLRIEIEARNISEVKEILHEGGIDRIMLDNFDINSLAEAVQLINGRFETEASGGINLTDIRLYAETGVDYISVGALTHHIKSLDLSLKII